MQTFDFTADVTITLANGDIVRRTLIDYVMADTREQAYWSMETVTRQIIGDWGCEELDAPVEAVEVISACLL